MATESDARTQIPIFDRARECSISFNKYLDITKVEENNRAMNQAANFNLWIKGIGAFAKGVDSADHFLKNRPIMRDTVLDLLDLLDQTLQQAIRNSNSKINYDAEHKVETKDDTDLGGEHHEDVNDSNDIGGPSENGRGSESDCETSSDDSLDPEPYEPGKDIDDTLFRLHQLLITIRRSAKEAFRQYMDQYIEEEFKKRYDKVEDFLCIRLLESNVERRKIFDRHAREHARHLAEEPSQRPGPPETLQTQTPSRRSSLAKRKESRKVSNPKSNTTISKFSAHTRQASSSSPSALVEEAFVLDKLTYPLPPTVSHEISSFDCPYCYRHLSASLTEKNHEPAWRAHIEEDLKPYICVFKDCLDSQKMYSTSIEWIDHMRETHMLAEVQHPNLLKNSSCRIPLFTCCPICRWAPEEEPGDQAGQVDREVQRRGLRKRKRARVEDELKSAEAEEIGEERTIERGKFESISGHEKRLQEHIAEHLKRIAFMALPGDTKHGSAEPSSPLDPE